MSGGWAMAIPSLFFEKSLSDGALKCSIFERLSDEISKPEGLKLNDKSLTGYLRDRNSC